MPLIVILIFFSMFFLSKILESLVYKKHKSKICNKYKNKKYKERKIGVMAGLAYAK